MTEKTSQLCCYKGHMNEHCITHYPFNYKNWWKHRSESIQGFLPLFLHEKQQIWTHTCLVQKRVTFLLLHCFCSFSNKQAGLVGVRRPPTAQHIYNKSCQKLLSVVAETGHRFQFVVKGQLQMHQSYIITFVQKFGAFYSSGLMFYIDI